MSFPLTSLRNSVHVYAFGFQISIQFFQLFLLKVSYSYTSVIPTSLFFSSFLSYSNLYPLTALYFSTNISYYKLFFYVFTTFTIRHSIPSDRAKNPISVVCIVLIFPSTFGSLKYESTSMSVTVRIQYFRKGCFWYFRKNISFICPQNS